MTCTVLNGKIKKSEFEKNGFFTKPFPDSLRDEMCSHIDYYIRKIGEPFASLMATDFSLEAVADVIPDEVWAKKMTRAFRIFPHQISHKIYEWADSSLKKEFGRKRSAVNVVYLEEPEVNSALTPDHLAIYWRCVRPNKPDAGRAHRDASFWDLEFKEGYEPKIPFPFNYLKDCVKIWIPLKGCIPSTTLQVIPSSHLEEVPTTVEQTEYGRRPSIVQEWLNSKEGLFMSPIELSQGSCICFDMNLVHRGPKHNNSKLRVSAELNFILQ